MAEKERNHVNDILTGGKHGEKHDTVVPEDVVCECYEFCIFQ